MELDTRYLVVDKSSCACNIFPQKFPSQPYKWADLRLWAGRIQQLTGIYCDRTNKTARSLENWTNPVNCGVTSVAKVILCGVIYHDNTLLHAIATSRIYSDHIAKTKPRHQSRTCRLPEYENTGPGIIADTIIAIILTTLNVRCEL